MDSKKYNLLYKKEKIKRIPLDVQKDFYTELKSAADAQGEAVNTFIKKAILKRLDEINSPGGESKVQQVER